MSNKLKQIPTFGNEAEERRFWETHDSTDYVDWSKAERVALSQSEAVDDRRSRLRLPVTLAGAHQDRRQQAGHAVSVADQGVARREGRRESRAAAGVRLADRASRHAAASTRSCRSPRARCGIPCRAVVADARLEGGEDVVPRLAGDREDEGKAELLPCRRRSAPGSGGIPPACSGRGRRRPVPTSMRR